MVHRTHDCTQQRKEVSAGKEMYQSSIRNASWCIFRLRLNVWHEYVPVMETKAHLLRASWKRDRILAGWLAPDKVFNLCFFLAIVCVLVLGSPNIPWKDCWSTIAILACIYLHTRDNTCTSDAYFECSMHMACDGCTLSRPQERKRCPHIQSDGNSSLKLFHQWPWCAQLLLQDSVLLRGFVVPQGDTSVPIRWIDR